MRYKIFTKEDLKIENPENLRPFSFELAENLSLSHNCRRNRT